MGMIRDERRSETKGFRLGDDITQTFNEIIPALIIWEYPPTLNYESYNFMGCPQFLLGFNYSAIVPLRQSFKPCWEYLEAQSV